MTLQKYPPKVQSKRILADIHISVWAAKGCQPFFSLCSGSIKCFMGAHNTLLQYVTWKINTVIKLSFRVSFESEKICTLCQPCSKFFFVFILWFGVAWQRCTSLFLPLHHLLFYEHTFTHVHMTNEKSIGIALLAETTCCQHRLRPNLPRFSFWLWRFLKYWRKQI